jgi:two-component system, NtrC family, sensor kinase
LMKPWYMTRLQLIGFLVGSITVILFVILALFTFLVNKVYVADQRRVMTLHEREDANKMASLGRLAAGVAHEINNPLAVINEKAGLVKDLFTFNVGYARDEKLIKLVDSVLASVERCGTITKRLLNFARHVDVSIQPIDVEEVIRDVLGFLGKEAEYRSIGISVSVDKNIPLFESDRGKLQQIFLNIINNAFAALRDGGRLEIMAAREGRDSISIRFKDNGCGIPEEHLQRVFEPFFSTKTREGGTGLGLSITYGLVQELGGHIDVESEVDKGTTFIITLPLAIAKKEKKTDEGFTG